METVGRAKEMGSRVQGVVLERKNFFSLRGVIRKGGWGGGIERSRQYRILLAVRCSDPIASSLKRRIARLIGPGNQLGERRCWMEAQGQVGGGS